MPTLEELITELPGFKIRGSHFRIGSKLHISDFYYAKRFFQNGFFSSRIAFLLAKDIITIVEKENRLNNIKNNGLTIIGYEMYSELLITLVDKFLRKRWELSETKINHNLYQDLDETKINHNLNQDLDNLKLCKKNNILGNVVIIVPIASTFSTAIKIENQILKDQNNKKPYILSPHLNVLYVSDGIPAEGKPTEIEKGFNWKSKNIEEKTIEVEAIYSPKKDSNRIQKYYLTVPTKWFNVKNCQLCNPTTEENNQEIEKLEDEVPLYDTDRTAVTPTIIFDFPKGRMIDDIDLKRKLKLDTKIVTYGHHKRSSHFLFSVDTEILLDKNKDSIQNWLSDIRKSEKFQSTYKETDRVIIVSTCHYSNAAFITLVNDFLFASAANIIHYDPKNDYLQNFKIVYGKEMNDADRIFFVDDSIRSGETFDSIYQFVQNTVIFSNTDNLGKGISGCFFLLNASQPYTFDSLKSKLIDENQIYAFANLHLNTSLKPSEISTVQIEQQRYRELRNSSFLDSLKVHFLKQFNKLAANENGPKELTNIKKAERHVEMFIATHRIYQYFTVSTSPRLDTFFEFLTDLMIKTESLVEGDEASKKIFTSLQDKGAKVFLKVITQAPFTQNKPFKDCVFKWVVQLLIEHLKTTEQSIEQNNFDYVSFNTLKFLIRRAGLLNSNALISKRFIEFMPKLYSKNGIPKIIKNFEAEIKAIEQEIEDLKSTSDEFASDNSGLFSVKDIIPSKEKDISELDEKISKLKQFHIFYAAQVKELLLCNESRCLSLEKILAKVDTESNPQIKQLVRILREENSLIIKVFYEHFREQDEWKKIYVQAPDTDTNKKIIDYTNDKIVNFLNKSSISRHHKFQTLNSYFEIINQPKITENYNLLNYLWLQYFLTTDKAKHQSLKVKTEFILKKLMQLFVDAGFDKIGAFFIVNDSRKNPFLAFNRNFDGTGEIDDDKLTIRKPDNKDTTNKDQTNDNSTIKNINYLNEFFRGESNSSEKDRFYEHFKTVIELERNENDKWVDLFTTEDSMVVKDVDPDLVSKEYNRLVLVRLSKDLSEKSPDKTGTEEESFNKTKGIIGLYYKNDSKEIIDINIIRYLLLLRPLLSRFIKTHHENDEFRDWQIAEIKQRTSLLTGHGREMLSNVLLNHGGVYKEIVQTLLSVQRLIIDKKEESEMRLDGEGRMKQMFAAFYQTKDSKVTSSFLNDDLKKMAVDIFNFDEIENKEDLEEPVMDIPENLCFKFDKTLLRLICFEILVNAKKNRWIFTGDVIFDKDGNKYDKNKIWIKARINQGKLILEISNTGPAVITDAKKVRSKKNIKKYDKSSGIELINTILTEFKQGKIELNPETNNQAFLSKFKVTLTLNENTFIENTNE